MKKTVRTLFLIFIFINHCYSQISEDKKLAKTLNQLIPERLKAIAPGCAVLIAKKGQVVYKKVFGLSNLELNVPMQPGMVFRIGSMTKQYTAIAILQLAEQGKLSLKDSVQKFIKDFPQKGYAISIENLLTHTSGIVGYDVLDFHIPNAIRIDFSPKQFIDSLAVLPLEFIPGTKYNYSNSNYLLLGYIIEQVTGKTYEKYLEENIFNPAGLSDTYYDNPTEIIRNRVTGYTKDSSGYRNTDYISMTQAFSAGALLSNVEDLFRWQMALYSGKLVKKETLEKAFTPFKFSDGKMSEYGYGWFIRDINGSKSIGHGGAIDGFRSMETYFPAEDVFIASLLNSDDDHAFNLFEDITAQVMDKDLRSTYKDLKISDTILNGYIGIYKFLDDTSQSIKVYKKDNRLYGELSNGSGNNMALLAQSATFFYLPDVRRIPTTIEFIVEDGKTKRLYWTQEKKHEAQRKE